MLAKSRKTHFLLAQIQTAFSDKTSLKTPYWTLFVEIENLYGISQERVYAFSNLVPKTIICTLQNQTYQGKKYYLECEKRVRGWRLVNWKEI